MNRPSLPSRARLLVGALAVFVSVPPALSAQAADAALVQRARAIHDRVITLDTHVDINPSNFTAERNYTQRLENQVNLPKMHEGGLDVAFLIVYVGQQQDFTPEAYQRAYEAAVEKFDAIHRLTKEIAPDRIGLALTADDVRRIAASGRKVALIGVENAYPLGEDLGKIREFYDRGGRYISLAHNGHSQWSDSNTGERDGWKWNGLSPIGRQAIAEMNRLGIMIDVSHPSKASSMQTFELSKAPVIASHSAVRALCNHSRNMDDEQLQALKRNGGVIQTVAFASYVKCATAPAERQPALQQLYEEFGLPAGGRGARGGGAGAGGGRAAAGGVGAGRGGRGGGRGALQAAIDSLPPARRAEFDRRMAEIDRMYPVPPRATVQEFVDHVDYAVKLIGIDHVGISSDFDGGGGVEGWSDASETFNVTLELVRRGYTEEQIGKLWSGNLLRVMSEVERVARESQRAR
ncbi:MAG TPA: dipeptidase [Gemmatimonadaceae bacterium]|nr:dipeptidase [Gemmatimonadaceae bacterium]